MDRVIAVLDSAHEDLTNQKTFYVEISRARESAILITDNVEQLAASLEHNTGERMTALEGIAEEPEAGRITEARLEAAIEDARVDIGLSLDEFEAPRPGRPSLSMTAPTMIRRWNMKTGRSRIMIPIMIGIMDWNWNWSGNLQAKIVRTAFTVCLRRI